MHGDEQKNVVNGPRGNRHSALEKKEVSASAVCKACNSIDMKVPDGQDLSQYCDKWDCGSRGEKGRASCTITFEGVDGNIYEIKLCCFFDARGKPARKLFLDPFFIDGKKIWIDNPILEELRWQAKCAFQKYLAKE